MKYAETILQTEAHSRKYVHKGVTGVNDVLNTAQTCLNKTMNVDNIL